MVLGIGAPALAAAPRDCDSNAIMWCGAYGKNELLFKYRYGDGHNAAKNLQLLYAAWGIGEGGMKAAVDGSVTKDGRVIVGGKTVATGARSGGRQFLAGSTKERGVWMRPTSVSFRSQSLAAYVYMKNGVFQWAVIKSCGNMVAATPVAVQKPPIVVTHVAPPVTPPAPTPTPAPELPETGMELPIVLSALGATSMGYGARGYLRSKRRLVAALRHK